MTEKRILRQTIQTQQRSTKAPGETYLVWQSKFVFRITFTCGGAIGATIAYLINGNTLAYAVFIIVMACIIGGGSTYLFVFMTTEKSFRPDIVTKTEEYEPKQRERTFVEPFRISGNGFTAEIDQPKPGEFVRWACEVLDNSKTYFSSNQANDRGFDYRQVIDGLRRVGVLEAKPDRNNVYHVVRGMGRQRLEEAIGRRPTPPT